MGTQYPHYEVVKEVREELAFDKLHPKQIMDDQFWKAATSAFEKNPHKFLYEHKCEALDYIVEHWKLDECSSHVVVPVDPPHSCVSSVPEPSTIFMFSIAIIILAIAKRRFV